MASNDLDRGWQVAGLALLARVCTYGLSLATHFAEDYDTSTRLYPGLGGSFVRDNVAHLLRWDAVYFIRIAEVGYEYEHVHAFYPGLPMLMRGVASLLPLEGRDALILAGMLISNASNIVAAVCLYRLGKRILEAEHTAFLAAVLFSFASTSIFMTTIYTESAFSLASFAGIGFAVADRLSYRSWAKAAACFALAVSLRSNGSLLVLFLLLSTIRFTPTDVFGFLRHWATAGVAALVSLAPMLAYSVYVYQQYCPEDPRPWCNRAIPDFYSFVQAKYWGVGLFKYYQLKQLPNFLLASPTLAVAIAACAQGFKSAPKMAHIIASPLTPFVLQLLLITITSILFVNIQVVSRLIVGCPLYWWQYARFLSEGGVLWKVVFFAHCLCLCLGPVLFSNFLPWT